MMEKLLNIGSAYLDIGEHDFLQHLTHEVKIGDKVIGHVMITAYNFREASQFSTAWKWLCHSESYLSRYKEYLFEPSMVTPRLPEMLSEEVTNSSILVIIDEITLDPKYRGYRLESYVLSEILNIYTDESEIVLLGNYRQLAETMGYDKSLAAVMYCQLGFVFLDDFVAVKFKSIDTDSLDEIADLRVELDKISI